MKYPDTHNEMLTHFGLLLTDEQLEFYASHDEITHEDLQDDCCDTIDRDLLIDAIVVDVLGEEYHWPLNMDDEEYSNKFYSLFFTSLDAKGIKVKE